MSARTYLKDFLWVVAAAGLAAGGLRFAFGLGATTGLNDASPWGLWIAFKLCFVALSGGGFTLAAMVYLFHLEAFHPVARRAVLLAFLGYGSFIVSLLFDLGLPWHIYMPIISWQHHSVMFEIAWCVLLYFSVLALEFGPAILEHPWFARPLFQWVYRLLRKAVVPLVIAGVVLSTLHQSSLGALFLIMPQRVHPLWYSPWIPVMFFLSAIAAGVLALVVENYLAQRLFGKGFRPELLPRLAGVAGTALWLYLALRLGDLFARRILPGALDGSWQSLWFGVEIGLGGLLPAGLLLFERVRRSPAGQLSAALLAILGVMSQRMSLSLFTMQRPLEVAYHPSLLEVIIAFAIPAAAGLLYLFFNEQLAILDENRPTAEPLPLRLDPVTQAVIQENLAANLTRRTGLAVLALAALFALLPSFDLDGAASVATAGSAHPVRAALGWEALTIDGNRSGYQVIFPHAAHQERLAGRLGAEEAACQACHHMQRPGDQATACPACHRDYYQPANIFGHALHQVALGGNASCVECHLSAASSSGVANVEHTRENAKACRECHADLAPPVLSTPSESQAAAGAALPLAPGYLPALHTLCRDCHQQQALELNKPGLAACTACHVAQPLSPVDLQAE